MASDNLKTIADVRSRIDPHTLTDESRLALLQAAKELQIDLETPFDTVHRYRYSCLDLIITEIFHNIKLFDVLINLGTAPMSTDDLARETQTDSRLLGRLLRYAASVRVVKQVSDDTWSASRLTLALNIPNIQKDVHEAFLDVPRYASALPGFLAKTNYKNPIDPVRTVHQFVHNADGMHWFQWAQLKENAEHYRALNAFLESNQYNKSGVEVFPFEEKTPSLFKSRSQISETALFVDIGGGRGQVCRAFRARYPDLPGRVIFQDLPNAVDEAEPKAGVEGMYHDFFEPQPIKGAKIYILRHVLHDWPDHKAEEVLNRVIEAMGPESVLLIDEKVLADTGTSTYAAGLDLQMMMNVAAQERSEKEWSDLLKTVGLKIEYLTRYKVEEGDAVMLVKRA